jgi:hypothetical protein
MSALNMPTEVQRRIKGISLLILILGSQRGWKSALGPNSFTPGTEPRCFWRVGGPQNRFGVSCSIQNVFGILHLITLLCQQSFFSRDILLNDTKINITEFK